MQSLLSDKGERAIEPYFFFDEGKAIAPKGRALIIHSLPQLPVHDRSFEKHCLTVLTMSCITMQMQMIVAKNREALFRTK